MLGGIIYKTMSILSTVIANEVSDAAINQWLEMQLVAVQEFLMFGYLTHLDKDNDPGQSTGFSCFRESMESKEMPHESACKYFPCPFELLVDIKIGLAAILPDVHDDLHATQKN